MRSLLAIAALAALCGCDNPEQAVEQPVTSEQKTVMVPAQGDPRGGQAAPSVESAQGASPSAPAFDEAQPGDQ